MRLDFDYKTLTSLVVSVLLVAIQAIQGVYADGIDGYEWLGIALVIFGPAGLVAAVNNTPWSPATKALVQHVSAVVIVLVQGLQGVYSNGISNSEWLGLALLLLSTLAVYVAPGASLVPAKAGYGNQAGYAILGALGLGLIVLTVLLLVLTLLKVIALSYVVLVVLFVIGLVLLLIDGHGFGTRRGGF
jgi:hypothetical protein